MGSNDKILARIYHKSLEHKNRQIRRIISVWLRLVKNVNFQREGVRKNFFRIEHQSAFFFFFFLFFGFLDFLIPEQLESFLEFEIDKTMIE